ncbi:MAG: exodeoxyribonuclease VII small subunit [Parachlamydiales bacterium]|nr:exodeoxyribonuclease VII small subunit [Parachlamydiales bacterium]
MKKTNEHETPETKTFESAFERLETILEMMNSGTLSLDQSLKFYEEADQLIALCSNRLNQAEQKVEVLLKARNGELALNSDNQPETNDFSPTKSSAC